MDTEKTETSARARRRNNGPMTDLYIEVDDIAMRYKEEHTGGNNNQGAILAVTEVCGQIKKLIREHL